MSYYQYENQAHLCPNAKSPIAFAADPRLHVVVRVSRGNTIDKQFTGFIRPGNPNFNEHFGGFPETGFLKESRSTRSTTTSLETPCISPLKAATPAAGQESL